MALRIRTKPIIYARLLNSGMILALNPHHGGIALMSWSQAQIGNKPADVFTPSGDTPPIGVVMFLHGYDGVTIASNPAFTEPLQKLRLAALCPLGPQCWWTDAVYPPFDETRSPIDFLAEESPAFCEQRWGIEPPKIAVCGVEMGGQGALQLAYRHARQFPIVVAISPKVDFDTWWGHGTTLDEIFPDRESARQRTATLHIHPLNYPKHQLLLCDPADHYCLDGVITLASKLSSSGVPFEHEFETTHGGFGWNYANQMAPRSLNYIAAALEKS